MKYILFLFLLPLFSNCSSSAEPKAVQSKDTLGLFAKHFKISEEGSVRTLEVLDPESGKTEFRLDVSDKKKYKVICLSATSLGMFCQLESQESVLGIPSEKYIHNSEIKQQFDKGKIQAYGDESALNVERIIASGANLVLYSGFGEEFPYAEQLNRIGIETLPIYDWRENDPLGKAEWIVAIGAICGKEELAKKYFEERVENYTRLKETIANTSSKPKVLSGNIFGDVWYAPAGESYVAQLISDAGGDYLFKKTDGTGSISLSMEEILASGEKDLWINPGMNSKELILEGNPLAAKLNSFDRVYCYSPNMNAFWENSAIQPDYVLEDLIRIFHPDLLPEGKFHFYDEIK